jgi:DNA polymerase-3 subunit epsilon
LLDAEILDDVYLLLSGGQTDLSLANEEPSEKTENTQRTEINRNGLSLKVILPVEQELAAHKNMLEGIQKSSGQGCLWLSPSTADDTGISA